MSRTLTLAAALLGACSEVEGSSLGSDMLPVRDAGADTGIACNATIDEIVKKVSEFQMRFAADGSVPAICQAQPYAVGCPVRVAIETFYACASDALSPLPMVRDE